MSGGPHSQTLAPQIQTVHLQTHVQMQVHRQWRLESLKTLKSAMQMPQCLWPNSTWGLKLNPQTAMELMHQRTGQWTYSSHSIHCKTVALVVGHSTGLLGLEDHGLLGSKRRFFNCKMASSLSQWRIVSEYPSHLNELDDLSVGVVSCALCSYGMQITHLVWLTDHHNQRSNGFRITISTPGCPSRLVKK